MPQRADPLVRIHLVGVWALYADRESEAPGTVGASVHLKSATGELLSRFDLVNGRHYGDWEAVQAAPSVLGDGTSIEPIGICQIEERPRRVDVLTLDIPPGLRPRAVTFKDLNSPASFVIFDVYCEYLEAAPDETRSNTDAISLSELGAAVRIGDRLRFAKALDQVASGIDEAEDLEDARSLAVAFISIVSAALFETSPPPNLQQLLLETLRGIEQSSSRSALTEALNHGVREMTHAFFAPSESATDRLMDRALAIVERHYAKDLTDSMVAAQLGLSTSHFRFLFRQATGHPFHKYVVALRLEKAKQMLIEQELPVSQVAAAVGFTGLSHFSRAFTQRFSASPSHIRRAAS